MAIICYDLGVSIVNLSSSLMFMLMIYLFLQSMRYKNEQRKWGLKNLKSVWFYISQQETLEKPSEPHDKVQWGERRQGNQPSVERRAQDVTPRGH